MILTQCFPLSLLRVAEYGLLMLSLCMSTTVAVWAQNTSPEKRDSVQSYQPGTKPSYKAEDRYGDPFSNPETSSPLLLKDPDRVKVDIQIDTSGNYTIYEKVGGLQYRPVSTMSLEEFKQYQEREQLKNYWKSRTKAKDGESAVSGRSLNPKIFISPILDRIFGGSYIELVPRGYVTLDFGAAFQRINNPSIPIRQQRSGGFEFDEQINLSVVGKVGEKLSVSANFDNNNSFDFQNNMKVEYTGFKEDILQKLEIGNVSLPLNNTLIQGSQNLFGVKAQMQFGKLKATVIASTQRGKASSVNVDGSSNGQNRPFEIIASNYDENRHFFLGHFFRDNYTKWISNTPQVISGINITRVEVYVLNRKSDTQTLRNVVGLMDLGEGKRIYNAAVTSNGTAMPASNKANNLFDFVTAQSRAADNINTTLETFFAEDNNNGTDFEKITGARKLAATEYTFHTQLGYLTLSTKLQSDEALAVSYEYTYNGKSYTVGELSEDYSNLKDEEVVFLKLLRPRKIAIHDSDGETIPTWDLMMKNIYTLGATQLSQSGFELRVIYRDDASGIDNPQLQAGNTVRTRQLVEIMGLDKLNTLSDRQRDGNFDFVEGVTINSTLGLIIFPYLKPFSEALREAFDGEPTENALITKYAYDTLYGTTKSDAALFASKNKFYITGEYTASSSSEIIIPGFGVAQGSVKVYAGGILLTEGTDYVVDYTFGKVTILNESIMNSGKDIEVQYEQSDAFSFQNKSLLGTRMDYKLNDDVNFGSTLLYYNERPTVSRNTVGTEPARNVQYGIDFNINNKSRMLTKWVDALPLIQTKEESTVNFTGEFAQLLPGTSNVIDGEGTGYIDDFENTTTPYSLMSPAGWKLSSVPKTDDYRFDPSGGIVDDITAGYKRGKIAWYTIDNQLQRSSGSLKPDNISEEDLYNHYVRGVGPQEIFPNKQLTQGIYYEQVFDVAYFPNERGPYNYNPSLDNNGLLPAPQDTWGAITKAVTSETDFDKANIEYIEFWMMDPFINLSSGTGKVLDGIFNKVNTTGGKLIFQLGNISEDVMRDSRHAFENGLPGDGNLAGEVAANSWGYVTTEQYLTSSFDNTSTSARSNQDVGFDGLPNEKEPEYFSSYLNTVNAAAREKVQSDPSGDNFTYFLDSKYDAANAKILQRYKDYNGQDGNSPIASSSAISYSSYLTPDNEDINADNTLNETEEYYQYDIDLKPGKLAVDNEYIVDKITTTNTNELEESVTWYLFRIPIREYESKFGNIEDFKSIKYVRMLLTEFKEPVVLRLANFRMVGSYWRRYTTDDLNDSGFGEITEPNLDNFTVSVVNLEENSVKDIAANKSGYIIPPGVVRDRDNTSSVSRLLNEQSVQVCIDDLADGTSRAIYKNLSVDLFNYGRVKMFFHANSEAGNDDLYAFIRLGTDFTDNYYEIQIPLKVSDASNETERGVWPEENEIDLALNELYTLKTARDKSNFSLTDRYPLAGPKEVGRHLLRILGRPDLSSVLAVMIGVRNPRTSDKRSYSVCLWANELRVTDFDRTAGWAVTSSANIKLADFATINAALRHTTYGFGSISSKISERTRDETTSYDVSAAANLDKLLPGNTGIKIPVFASYENSTATPNYDPANPDVKLSAALEAFNTEDEKREYLKIIQDRTVRRSLNFTNVRKVKVNPNARSNIWDVENLSFSYSYSDAIQKDFTTVQNLNKQYKGSVVYNFSPKTTGIEPFKNSAGLSSPWLKLIKDFNISLMPANINVRMDLNRSFTKTIYRNSGSSGDFVESDASYVKYFVFNRQYNVKWNLSKNLSFEYAALANAVIDEPEGDINTQEKKDSVMHNLKKLGRMKNFTQGVTLNYTLPLDKIPATDWLSADYRFHADYTWKAGTYNKVDSLVKTGEQDLVDSLDFKNTIQNSRTQNIAGRIDMVKLYNKIKFLKVLNTPARPSAKSSVNNRTQTRIDTVKASSASINGLVKGILKLVMSVRSINATYSLTEGTVLPGFNDTPKYFGMSEDWSAPGWGFLLGSQDPEMRFTAARNNLLTKNSSLTTMFTQSRSETITLSANLEPSPTLKITLNAKKENITSYEEIFRYDPDQATDASGFASLSPNRSGSYAISTISIKTAFDKTNGDIDSDVFRKFEENLIVMQNRFMKISGNEYDTASQDILIPAFIAAYTGSNAGTISLTPFPKMPKPNWRVDYSGLGNIKALKNIFQNFTVSHAYQSTYAVSAYSNSLEYTNVEELRIDRSIEDYNTSYYSKTVDGSPVPVYVISQVILSEQFSPLVGISARTKSKVTASLQYKTRRDLTLTVSNAQVTEISTKDIAFEIGFTRNNMKLPFKSQGRTVVLKNDLTFRLNTTVSDTRTIQRKIDDVNTLTSGAISIQIRPTVSYVVNKKLNLQFYFTRSINEPLVSSSYRRATTNAGVQVRFSLAE
ncbi:cell surface protein SprA [Ohtaekwangia koreensis]|uniref:Cell surface protein SprA n=2 Tax=Ohtaekwangia koreensis TaxID=688867 RepID=A0A1T5IRL8_9BACT|nr:cell surface protein SprA [Ohtaekwangia koreensis]